MFVWKSEEIVLFKITHKMTKWNEGQWNVELDYQKWTVRRNMCKSSPCVVLTNMFPVEQDKR